MFEFVKDIFRKSSLKKNASTVETGFLPLNRIRSYVAVILSLIHISEPTRR